MIYQDHQDNILRHRRWVAEIILYDMGGDKIPEKVIKRLGNFF